jgi:hypothetical protein
VTTTVNLRLMYAFVLHPEQPVRQILNRDSRSQNLEPGLLSRDEGDIHVFLGVVHFVLREFARRARATLRLDSEACW